MTRDKLGLIPARAGSTVRHPEPGGAYEAHPRSRGEHDGAGHFGFLCLGSSPLARGARADRALAQSADGLIPARAGSTRYAITPRSRSRAHPRSRGEHHVRANNSTPIPGSSPLARGAHECVNCLTLSFGLIPARAGSTC